MESSSPTIKKCIFSQNMAESSGGGIMNYSNSSPTILNCIFSQNEAANNGGGINNYDNSSPSIAGCMFLGNIAGYGGGLYNYQSSPNIINCTFSKNIAKHEGGGIRNIKFSSPVINNTIFWGDVAANNPEIGSDASFPMLTYCNIQGGHWGTGNMNTDPLFDDPENDNFHLQAISPCIDKGGNAALGLPDIDFEGDNRIVDGDNDGFDKVDIGADEYVLSSGGSADGDIAPLGSPDGIVNVGDALVALRVSLILETPSQGDILHGDVAPLDSQGQPNPDGQISVGDALVILRKALGIISF
jgi:predicted outer membrane repeat protein